jgi:class 3 adenylate cyclase
MSLRVMTWFYRKLGSLYPAAFLTVELQSALLVTAGTVGLATFYYDADGEQFLQVMVIALGMTALAIGYALVRVYRRLRPIQSWIGGTRGPDDTARAWSAAVGLPLTVLRRDLPLPVTIAVVTSCAAGVAVLELPWMAFFPFLAFSAVAVGYAALLHYLAIESGMRPVLLDISQDVSPRLRTETSTLPLRWRLMATLPLINIITGLVVAAFTSDGGGAADLGVDVLVAVAVATTISLELTIMLSKSILRPIADLQRATEAVREGRYDVAVPVTTGDELGDLASSFNQMVSGLRERERIRKAFGTYLDEEVAEYILSDRFSERGVELEVSILFCDVENFTAFAAQASATEVVARLNELFEIVVPVVRRHGGHVDKFEGDGLLAVFGAPEPHPDHADRAVGAGVEMAARVNGGDGLGFRIGVGVNTGRVVAGNIGGAGRFNFSVIGDPVNVGARTQEATRRTPDDVLITAETARHLRSDLELAERPGVDLRGVDGPVTLYAPSVPDLAARPGDGHAETFGMRLRGVLGAPPGRTSTLPGP